MWVRAKSVRMRSDKSIERHDPRTVLMNYGMSMVTGPHISEPHGGSMLVAPGCPARGYRGCEKKWFRTPAGFHVRTRSDGQKASFCDCSRVARRTCRSEAERQVALRAAAVLFIFPISPPVAASQQPGATDMEPLWGSHGEQISHFLRTPLSCSVAPSASDSVAGGLVRPDRRAGRAQGIREEQSRNCPCARAARRSAPTQPARRLRLFRTCSRAYSPLSPGGDIPPPGGGRMLPPGRATN